MGTPAKRRQRTALRSQLIDGRGCAQRTLAAHRQISIDGRILRLQSPQNKAPPTRLRWALRRAPLFEPRRYRSASNSYFHYAREHHRTPGAKLPPCRLMSRLALYNLAILHILVAKADSPGGIDLHVALSCIRNQVACGISKQNFLTVIPRCRSFCCFYFPFAVQVPFWLLGLSTDPIWFYSSIISGTHLVPGSPFLDPNAGFTSEALGHLVAWDWVHGVIPWWNPYTGIGVPLAGELQPGAFFLPFNLLLLLKEGVLWQRIAMQIIAGLATYALLRELGLSRLAAFLGGALFAVNGVIAWTPGPAAVYCSIAFSSVLAMGH